MNASEDDDGNPSIKFHSHRYAKSEILYDLVDPKPFHQAIIISCFLWVEKVVRI